MMKSFSRRGVLELAEQRVRSRLNERSSWDLRELVIAAGLPPSHVPSAQKLLADLGANIGLDVTKLRPDDRMSRLLRVARDELPEIASAWEKHGFGEYVEVFSYDIMHVVESLADPHRWRDKWQSLDSPPANEEEWLDRIMDMTVGAFLIYFVATMRR